MTARVLSQRTKRPRVMRRRGFSLVELLIAMTLLTIIMGALVSVMMKVQRDYTRQRVRGDGTTALRTTEILLGRAFRSAGADPNLIGVVGILAEPNGTSSVRLRGDFNPADGDVADPLEDIQFDLVDGEMRVRWQAGATIAPLVRPVSGLTFTYYRRDGTQVTNLAHVDTAAARVRIVVTAPVQRANGTTTTLRSESWAFVRN